MGLWFELRHRRLKRMFGLLERACAPAVDFVMNAATVSSQINRRAPREDEEGVDWGGAPPVRRRRPPITPRPPQK